VARAKPFYAVIVTSTLLGINSSTLPALLKWSALFLFGSGEWATSTPLLILIMIASGDRMSWATANGRLNFAWAVTTGIMSLAAVVLGSYG